MQVQYRRLSEIVVKYETRDIIRRLKADKSYDKFLNELVSLYLEKKEGLPLQQAKYRPTAKKDDILWVSYIQI